MAEGDSAQNQGQQHQSDESKEPKKELVDQQKLDRAEKERERRRRRRRKKAELRRLERETLGQQNGDQIATQAGAQKGEVKKPEAIKAKTVEPKKIRKPRAKQKSEKDLEPEQAEVPIHETHSFSGPLLEPKLEPKVEEQKIEPLPQPESDSESGVEPAVVSTLPLPEEPEPTPQPLPEPEPAPPAPPWEPASPEPTPSEPTPSSPSWEPEPSQQSVSQPVPQPLHEPEPEQPGLPEELGGHPADPPSPWSQQGPQTEEPARHAQEPVEIQPTELPPELPSDIHSEAPQYYGEEQQKKYEEDRSNNSAADFHAEEPDIIQQPSNYPQEENYHQEQPEAAEEVVPESEGLNERKSPLQGAGGFSAGVLKTFAEKLHKFRLIFNFRKLGVFVLLMFVGGALYAGYLFKVPEKIAGIFKSSPPAQKTVETQIAGETGITPALVFGDNRGSVKDLVATQLSNSYYFGLLSEPRIDGETGVTPAYYYGTQADLNAATNKFIGYVTNLRELISSYDVDIYQMLNQTTQREDVLTAHLTKLKDLLNKSSTVAKELNLEIDDTKISYDSLNPDRTRFETDFFVALQGLAGQKADFLLKSFVDVSQKQVALKAHLAALQQLLVYYTAALKNLTIRITGIEKNYQVLAQGIKVVDIPGANLDIILKQNP